MKTASLGQICYKNGITNKLVHGNHVLSGDIVQVWAKKLKIVAINLIGLTY
jgi:hypothetical protein